MHFVEVANHLTLYEEFEETLKMYVVHFATLLLLVLRKWEKVLLL